MKHHKYQQNCWNENQPSQLDWDGIVIVAVCVAILVSSCLFLYYRS
jgi:hypothetical protein